MDEPERPPSMTGDGLQVPLTPAFTDYWAMVGTRTRETPPHLPPPLLPDNGENSDGFCYMVGWAGHGCCHRLMMGGNLMASSTWWVGQGLIAA